MIEPQHPDDPGPELPPEYDEVPVVDRHLRVVGAMSSPEPEKSPAPKQEAVSFAESLSPRSRARLRRIQ
ncbi:hypothetical protein MBOU_14430 [Mycobacterium bourgelatii]|uniref:Uncharacterized protein n=1 Tax=Mycobacterium bourgelatii TaxID=1273442 RepID=A0A7I9YL52_MYCBU|nr:hypothetical protein MBOU_14430 [Mycobacterium bourgelatii]